MNRKQLTIVVPSYNAEAYLKKNIDSILKALSILKNQEKDDACLFEILVINDGSTDQTREIAERYAMQSPAIVRVINQENGGHGAGINSGIEYAEGKYFKVIDADDWVDPDAFAQFLLTLKDADADIVYSGFEWAIEQGNDEFRYKKEFSEPFHGVVYGKEYRFDDIADRLYIKMHQLTIKTSILREHDIHIDRHCFYVDCEYIMYPIPYVQTVLFTEYNVYKYRIGRVGQSMDPAKLQRNEKQFEHVLQQLLKFYGNLKEDNSSVDSSGFVVSESKMRYIENLLARIYAGRVKIVLSYKPSKEKRLELIRMDKILKEKYPKVYSSNQNKAIQLLRYSGFWLYYLAAMALDYKTKAKNC